MQAPNHAYQAGYEFDYGRRTTTHERRRRRPSYSSRNRPVTVNGLHRRRHKRISW